MKPAAFNPELRLAKEERARKFQTRLMIPPSARFRLRASLSKNSSKDFVDVAQLAF
jgi:hypothetical protein